MSCLVTICATVFLLLALLAAPAFSAPVRPDPWPDVLAGFSDVVAMGGKTAKLRDLSALDGFDGPSLADPEAAPVVPAGRRIWTIGGELSLFSSVNLNGERVQGQGDFRGLSHLRSRLDLDIDVDLPASWQLHAGGRVSYDIACALKGRNDFSRQYLNENETELELHEAYLDGALLADLDLKVGRQIVAWGTSETLRVVDVLNPLDSREPGLTDIEDLRLPVFMTRLDYFPATCWRLTAVLVSEMRAARTPPYGSDYHAGPASLPAEHRSRFSARDQELALALTGRFSGWDMSLHAAWIRDEAAYLSGGRRKHARIFMGGGTCQAAMGNWLLKAETALFSGLRYSAAPEKDFHRGDLLLGVEYSGFEDTSVTFEGLLRQIFNHASQLAKGPCDVRRHEAWLALRVAHDLLNDTLHLLATGSFSRPLAGGGGLGRLEACYDLSDTTSVRGGLVYYFGGSNPFHEAMEHNDRLFLEVKYSF